MRAICFYLYFFTSDIHYGKSVSAEPSSCLHGSKKHRVVKCFYLQFEKTVLFITFVGDGGLVID